MEFKQLGQAIAYPIEVYLLLLLLTRIIGRKLLSQLTFFDFVVGITIGTIGGTFVTTEVKGYYVLLSIVILTILVFITAMISLKSVTARKLIEGEAVILIQKGKIMEGAMKKLRYNQDLLMSQLRNKDVFDLTEVEYAILESHGTLTVMKKDIHKNVTKKDLNIFPNYNTGLSTELIRDGRIEIENLNEKNLTRNWLIKELEYQNIKSIEDVFLATLSADGKLYIDSKKDNISNMQKGDDQDSIIR